VKSLSRISEIRIDATPALLSGGDELENHGHGGLSGEAVLRSLGSVPDGGESRLDGVCRA